MASKELNNEEQQDVRDNSNGVGALLKASRVRLGDDLRFVAETLHIRFIYLEAIEAGRYDDLPGAAYAIGFIRSYADYLGLDSGEVVRRYKAESSGGSGATRLVFPVPIPESSIPGGAIIFVGVVVALLTYGVWYVSTAKDGFLAGLVSQVPERLSEQTQPKDLEFKIEQVAPEVTPETIAEAIAETTPETTAEATETQEVQEASEVQEPAAEVVETQETTTPPEQVVAEIEKQVVETVNQPAEQATPEITPEVVETPAPVVAEAVAKVEEKVAEEQQPVVADVAQKVEEASQVVATEADVSVSPSVSEPAPSAAEETPVAAPFVAEPASAPAPLQAVAEDPPVEESPVEESGAAIPTSTQTASTSSSTGSSTSTTISTPSNEVYGAENENSRILVKARKNSWIQVRDNNANRLLLTRLLRAGDSYRVPDQPGLVLLTGNAGALEILVDGEVVPDLGEAGKVRRNVTLDPDLLRQGAAAN